MTIEFKILSWFYYYTRCSLPEFYDSRLSLKVRVSRIARRRRRGRNSWDLKPFIQWRYEPIETLYAYCHISMAVNFIRHKQGSNSMPCLLEALCFNIAPFMTAYFYCRLLLAQIRKFYLHYVCDTCRSHINCGRFIVWKYFHVIILRNNVNALMCNGNNS